MPITSTHPDYTKYAPRWERIRACLGGEDEVKAGGEKYLPRPSGQDKEDYDAYKERAHFYGASGSTLRGLLGSLFRKLPKIALPDALKAHEDDATLEQQSLVVFLFCLAKEVLSTGRVGILPDFDEERERAYLSFYPAEAITDWPVERRRVVEIRLKECYEEPDPSDPWERKKKEQYRVLDLVESGETETGFAYRQRVFRIQKAADGKEEWAQWGDDIFPRARGGALFGEIPFVFLGASDLDPEVDEPPLLALANANLKHYQADADITHGLHLSSLPTPWFAGAQLKPEILTRRDGTTVTREPALKIGSGTAWNLGPPEASCGFLEPTLAGLETYRNRQLQLEDLMVHLGASLLQNQKKAAEAAEALRLRSSGESATLSLIADNLSAGATRAMRHLATFEGVDPQGIEIRANKDFLESGLSPEQIKALVETWQKGGITIDTLVYNLSQGEILEPDADPKTYPKQLLVKAPVVTQPSPAPPLPPAS